MTAKEYLQQAFWLNKQIKTSREELENLRELAKFISSPDLSSEISRPGGITDKVGNSVAKIVDLEIEINQELIRYINLKCEIRERVSAIETDNHRIILQMRYLNFEKWKSIVTACKKSEQWVHEMHGRALKEFSKKYYTHLSKLE